ncbi:MAG: hypothetical protein MOGMAGMI_00364 [Candidatus Omnitrophica bacterium]|nr:hypothetical protein [Candidatus Omnitrophota bacterium]
MSKILEFLKNNIVSVVVIAIISIWALKTIDKIRQDKNALHTELIGKTQELEKLSKYSANLERVYVSQEELKKKLQEEFAEEKASLEGKIKLLSNATFLIRENARKTNQSDIVYAGSKTKFVINEIRFENGPAVGYVLIYDDGRVVSKLYNHEIDVKTATSQIEETGKYNVVTKANYILKSPSLAGNGSWTNKEYPLEIKGGQAFIDPVIYNKNLSKQFFFWAPKLNAHLTLDPKTVSPGLGVSIMGYGLSRNDLDWKFLHIGTSYKARSEDLSIDVIPFMFRPFDSFMSNTYIGPGYSFGKESNSIFIGISVGF